jgi:hypothetical protein
MILNSDQEVKFQELLLNKVKNLYWTYFEINLNDTLGKDNLKEEADKNVTPIFLKKILDDIIVENGIYVYHKALDADEYKKLVFDILVASKQNPQLLKNALDRIFKNNLIKNDSDADENFLGKMNKKEKKRRDKKYFDKINNGFKAKPNNLVVLAEGDSWLQFPKLVVTDVVKDIVDHLSEKDDLAVYSIASGGDWLSNIMRAGDFINDLPKIKPDVFLISGGGNDMVGGKRLATMLKGKNQILSDKVLQKHQALLKLRVGISDFEKYKRGIGFTNGEFLDFINVCFIQYFIFFHNLIFNTDKYKDLVFITQGYDFALPSDKKLKRFWRPLQGLVNTVNGSGKWLFTPCMMVGLTDPDDQKAAVFAMIYEFNEMLIQIANYSGFPNLYHIDCRGAAKPNDWYDELHLNSAKFAEVAEVFHKCIKDTNRVYGVHKTKKVYKVI